MFDKISYSRIPSVTTGTTQTLKATGFTPLSVNLEIMSSKPNAGWDSKDCVAWKLEKAVLSSVHADKVTTDSPTD